MFDGRSTSCRTSLQSIQMGSLRSYAKRAEALIHFKIIRRQLFADRWALKWKTHLFLRGKQGSQVSLPTSKPHTPASQEHSVSWHPPRSDLKHRASSSPNVVPRVESSVMWAQYSDSPNPQYPVLVPRQRTEMELEAEFHRLEKGSARYKPYDNTRAGLPLPELSPELFDAWKSSPCVTPPLAAFPSASLPPQHLRDLPSIDQVIGPEPFPDYQLISVRPLPQFPDPGSPHPEDYAQKKHKELLQRELDGLAPANMVSAPEPAPAPAPTSTRAIRAPATRGRATATRVGAPPTRSSAPASVPARAPPPPVVWTPVTGPAEAAAARRASEAKEAGKLLERKTRTVACGMYLAPRVLLT